MSNVKAGDLAIVVGSFDGRGIGRIVEVISQCPMVGSFPLPCGHWGRRSNPGTLAWIIKYVGGPGYDSSQCTHAHIVDVHLKPLPGDESTDDTTITCETAIMCEVRA